MSWNLWWRFGDPAPREDAIITVLRREHPDVVCIQEAWIRRVRDGEVQDQVQRLADALGWYAASTEPVWFHDESFANAVLSRWPLRTRIDTALPGADGAPGHRRVLGVEVATPWGPWPVLCAHLDHRFDGSATRQRQCRALLEHAADLRHEGEDGLPVMLGADLNAVPDSDEVRMLTGRRAGGPGGIVFSDVWEQVGDGPGYTWWRGNPQVADSTWPDRRIDQLMVAWPRPKPIGNPIRAWLAGDHPEPVSVAVGAPERSRDSIVEVWPSDHCAVLAELRVPEPAGDSLSGPPR